VISKFEAKHSDDETLPGGFCIYMVDAVLTMNAVLRATVTPDSTTGKMLEERLKAAWTAHRFAIQQFQEVLRDIPSNIPHPDSSERITQASRRLTECHDEIIALLSEMNKTVDGDGKRR